MKLPAKRAHLFALGLMVICGRVSANVNEAAEDPGYIKYVGMRQYIDCVPEYFSTSSCEHYLNPGEVLGFIDETIAGCTVTYVAENVTLIPRPGFQQYQVWISDWPWQELVANEDGSNPRWENRVTTGHWITASLPTARSAAPGPWNLESLAANPLGYYNADPVQFMSMLPDWHFNVLISGGAWGDWTIPDTNSLRNAQLARVATTTTWPTDIPKPGAGAWIVTAVYCLLEVGKQLDFSYITYEKEHRTVPSHSYFGQSFGRGPPDVVRWNRDRYHERNGDHWPSRLRSSVYAYGPSDYGDFAMHGREQQLVDYVGGLTSAGGNATNTIRPVSRGNLLGYSYWLTANHAFGWITDFTGYPWLQFGFVPPANHPYSTIIDVRTYP
jgi:hypothetical protein